MPRWSRYCSYSYYNNVQEHKEKVWCSAWTYGDFWLRNDNYKKKQKEILELKSAEMKNVIDGITSQLDSAW